MKRKIISVLLSLALLLTLSVNASAKDADTQTVPVTNEITVNVIENNSTVITEPITTDSGATRTAGATPTGHLDTVSSTMIGGWAYQSNIPNTALQVHIYIINNSTNEQKIIPVTANGYRADLAAAGYGNGYHAFQYNISWKTYKPGTYTVRAYAIGVNSSNPQLNSSPKTFTVRNPSGSIDSLNSNGIGGWAWKPDAPNSPIDVHIYIYKTDGTQVAFYPVTANKPRSDLAAAGYGNGEHGFIKTIDWSTLPEENLRVVVHIVDGSGYNPLLYQGYYDNRMPINVIGMVDSGGVDFSTWATSEVRGYLYNIGTPNVYVSNSATADEILDKVKQSSFAVISTHGSQHSIQYCKNPNTTSEQRGDLRWNYVNAKGSGYFSNTRCLLLNSCSSASEEISPGNSIANAFIDTGVQAVVGFEKSVYFIADNGIVDNSIGSERWAKVFVCELGEGKTVINAKDEAISDAVASFEDKDEPNAEKRYNDAFKIAEEWGLTDVSVKGNGNIVVKH